MIERILVPLDGTDLSAAILPTVARLGRRDRAQVRAVRVLDGFTADQAMLRGEDPIGIANGELGRALEPLRREGFVCGFDASIGDPAAKILDEASAFRPSLIAMASHGRAGADLWLRGSVAERVLRESSFPLYLATKAALAHEPRFGKILVPLDGSNTSAEVLPVAVEFARSFDAELVLLHVADGLTGEGAEAMLARHRRELEALGLRARTVIAKGSPAFAILSAAKNEGADLVAMTTHGRSGPSRWIFGSTAEHVLHQCHAPLLVVRTARGGKS